MNHAVSCNLVIFGGNGDLAMRKLLPALYYLDKGGHLGEATHIIGASRAVMDDQAYRELVRQALEKHLARGQWEQGVWERFASRLSFAQVDAQQPDSFYQLKNALEEGFQRQVTIYYLSTTAELYGAICQSLRQHGLLRADSRVVMEKPIGKDLESSMIINDAVASVVGEEQIYRIDHYLGKEAVQNLLVLRFANALFEPVWSRSHIDNIQITVAETVGVEGRWGYYDSSGALRDMVQNHLLQLLCLVAMGVPVNMDAESLRNEKVKVLQSLKVLRPEEVLSSAIRGQYAAGNSGGEPVPGYREEEGSRPDSETETFVAIRADIHNWRWRGVPFYLRTGKRLPSRFSEIVLQFRDVPHSIFADNASLQANKLVIRLQPEEGIQLIKMNKVPGLSAGVRMQPVSLNLMLPEKLAAARVPDAHERLIYDVIRGDSTLFVHRREVEAAWRWCDAIMHGWRQQTTGMPEYSAGSWGPQAAYLLTARNGHLWHETSDRTR